MAAALGTLAGSFVAGVLWRPVVVPWIRGLLRRAGCLRSRPVVLQEAQEIETPPAPREVWQFCESENVHDTNLPLVEWWQDMKPMHCRQLSAAWASGFRGEVDLEDTEGYVAWIINLETMEQLSWTGRERPVRRIHTFP